MTQITVEDAAPRLSELVRQAQGGEEIILTQDSGPAVRLTPLGADKPRPQFGSAQHLTFYMGEDFNDIPEGFEEYI